MDEDVFLTVDFSEPIEIVITIDKIDIVETHLFKKSIWIEGKEVSTSKDIGFYCPKDLEFILRNIEITVGDTVVIRHLKNNLENIGIDKFYVRREPDNGELLEQVLDKDISDDGRQNPISE